MLNLPVWVIAPIMRQALYSKSYGEGERALILLHGLFGQGSNLGLLARELAQDFRVVVPDLRNHGRSFHAAGMDYRSMAHDVLELMDASGIDRAALLGHSMGGKVAMQLALDQPDRVSRVIVGDIAPVAYASHHSSIFAALRQADAPGADRRQTQSVLEQSIKDSGVVALLLMNRARHEDGSWFWRFNLDAIMDGYTDVLAAPAGEGPCRLPILFIKGGHSDYINAAHEEITRRLFPDASLRIIADAGHWLHAEKPQLFLRLVQEFMLPGS